MGTMLSCPVCGDENCRQGSESGNLRACSIFDCQVCGQFGISFEASVNYFNQRRGSLTALQRAALSHQLRTAQGASGGLMITTDWMERFSRNARLPSPPEQATNLIRLIGDTLAETGEGRLLDGATDAARVGAFNAAMFEQLRKELETRNVIQRMEPMEKQNPRGKGVLTGYTYGLTLDGWERYEAERHGRVAGRYGFIAMQFSNAVLDPFVDETIKPAVLDGIGYNLVDLRDVSRAGVIDNILREQIRDAAFILVDLTHDNPGAYWEAGYAEGLGKPVVYLCERNKFDSAKTHFDTNHCTTVLWSTHTPDDFRTELIATLRRSLNLFPPSMDERSTR